MDSRFTYPECFCSLPHSSIIINNIHSNIDGSLLNIILHSIKRVFLLESFVHSMKQNRRLCRRFNIVQRRFMRHRINREKAYNWKTLNYRNEDKMKRIGLETLMERYRISEYSQVYKKVLDLIEQGEIKPVKASGLNGKKPALYKEYWSIEKEENMELYINELKFDICPSIDTTYYLTHLKQYKEDRQFVLALNEYLKKSKNKIMTQMSENERSFDIWGREKFLKQEQGKRILKNCGISVKTLNFYTTTEPLSYYSHTRNTPQNLLIIENKDTFYSMRQFLMQDNQKILGIEFGTLIYGAGKAIIKSFQDFDLCAEPYMRDLGNKIYYFGDLDYEGILIYEKLALEYSEKCEIVPFTKAYLKMVSKAGTMNINLPNTKEGQNRNAGELFFGYFTKEQAKSMMEILERDEYIPQEILNTSDL